MKALTAFILISSFALTTAAGASSIESAREQVVSGAFYRAITEYKGLIDESSHPDAELASEYAYSLALAGHYEPALVNLDCARLRDPECIQVYYYASQVYLLMGFSNQQFISELWPAKLTPQTPDWISMDGARLLSEYKNQNPPKAIDDLAEEFSKANLLLSQQCYFQAIASFESITRQFPDKYVPYAGYSIALEKAGAPRSSLKVLKECQRIAGPNGLEPEMSRQVKARISMLSKKINSGTTGKIKSPDSLNLKKSKKNSLFYIGGQVSENTSGLNMRMGTYSPGGAELGINLGYYSSSLTAGFSAFTSFGAGAGNSKVVPVLGGGLRYSSSDFFAVLTAGMRIPVSKDSTIDLMADVELQDLPRLVVTLGLTNYFGQR